MTALRRLLMLVALALLSFVALAAWARPALAETGSEKPLELSWSPGPRSVELGHDLTMALPEGYVYLEPRDGARLLESMGSLHSDDLVGLVASASENEKWVVIMRYAAEGFVKDDEALDAKEILASIRDAQEEANEERVKRGFTKLTIDGWSEVPRYDRALHHLVWSLDVSDPDGTSVNYSTRILGRRGFIALNFVTAPEALAAEKHHATTLLAATTFAAGARYEDFDRKNDKVAEYGLVGLILGGAGVGAAKLVKVGLLAKFGKVLLGLLVAGKKLVVLILIAILGALKKLFAKQAPGAPSRTERGSSGASIPRPDA